MPADLARILAIVVVVLGTLSLSAQQPGMLPPPDLGPPPPTMLLSQKVVQHELKLTREQIGKVEQLRAREMQALAPRPGVAPTDMATKMKEMTASSRKALGDILKPAQAQRFKEISLQAQGANALVEPELAEAVGLDEEQRTKIKGICDAGAKERASLFQGKPMNPAALHKAVEQVQKKTGEKILGELTSAQRAKWEEMQGKPVKGLVLAPHFPGLPPR